MTNSQIRNIIQDRCTANGVSFYAGEAYDMNNTADRQFPMLWLLPIDRTQDKSTSNYSANIPLRGYILENHMNNNLDTNEVKRLEFIEAAEALFYDILESVQDVRSFSYKELHNAQFTHYTASGIEFTVTLQKPIVIC